jgi:hypothetical protein
VRSGLLLICALTICSCATARVEAVRDPAPHDRINRLLVVIVDDESNDADLMKASLHGQLEAKRIDHRIVAISGASDAPRVDAVMRTFGPQAVLRIVPTAVTRGQTSRVRLEMRYDASLFPADDDQHRIWRARMIHHAGSLIDSDESGMPLWMDLVARQLVDRMIVDGVIGPS